MTDCPHSSLNKHKSVTSYLGKTFECEIETCTRCGKEIWSEANRASYQDWLNSLKRNQTLLVRISQKLQDRLHRQAKNYPGVSETRFALAIVETYLSLTPVEVGYLNRLAGTDRSAVETSDVSIFEVVRIELSTHLFISLSELCAQRNQTLDELGSEGLQVILSLMQSRDEETEGLIIYRILPRIIRNLYKSQP